MTQEHGATITRRTWPVHNHGYVCPSCGSWRVVPALADSVRRRFCAACESCWEQHGNTFVRVDPLRCSGCGREAECYERLQRIVPTFSWHE